MIWSETLRRKSQGHTGKLDIGLDEYLHDDKESWVTGKRNEQEGHPTLNHPIKDIL